MQFVKWRKRQYAYDPMRGLRHNDITAHRKNSSKEQPHRQRGYVWRNYSKDRIADTGLQGALEYTGCDCHSCDVYYNQLLAMNPARVKAMLGLSYIAEPESQPEHIGSVEDGDEMIGLLDAFADIGPITVRCAFVRRVNEKKQAFSEQRYRRDSNAKSSIKWRG